MLLHIYISGITGIFIRGCEFAGLIWMMRNDKLVVAGFPVGSLAKQLGVRHGDILKSPARTAAMKCPALTSQMDVSQVGG